MAQPDLLDEWEFGFGLSIQTPGKSISYSDVEGLMNGIVRRAEGKGYGIGDGSHRSNGDGYSNIFPVSIGTNIGME
jgi:hypothetical protein